MVRAVTIVGLGPWGLAVLERLLAVAVAQGVADLVVDVVEPRRPGSGVYDPAEPQHLILNTPCGQHSMFGLRDPADPLHALTFHAWAVATGHRWHGDECVVRSGGREISPHDFLPRALMGRYLEDCYARLVDATPSVRVVHHRTVATSITPWGDAERVLLADGHQLRAEHVVLAPGLLANVRTPISAPTIDPYETELDLARIAPGSHVAVTGMGLVAMDVMASLSIGRGGVFVRTSGNRLRYQPSGREPVLHLLSRSGYPYCAKPTAGRDPVGSYEPVICTPEAAADLRASAAARGGVDARSELLPLVFAEMHVRWLAQSALIREGATESAAVVRDLALAWTQGDFRECVAAYSERYGDFDPAEHFLPVPSAQALRDRHTCEAQVIATVTADLDEALVVGGASPTKTAYDVVRALRDTMRSVIEYQGLSPASHHDFQRNLRTRVNRLIAGPPALRSQQLLALHEAGLVRVDFGPAPLVTPVGSGRVRVASTALDEPHVMIMDAVVEGRLDEPILYASSSPLVQQLYNDRRLSQLELNGQPTGSVALTRDFHPVDAEGAVAPRLWLFGAITEGTRYFTAYIPSPASRIRAFLDADWAANAMLVDMGSVTAVARRTHVA
jgi:uncharacterized NAD(P)/FAD-binding protein YdhS